MPILDYAALYLYPPDIGPPIAIGRPIRARIRFGESVARRLKRRRRPRRTRLEITLVTTSGTYRGSLTGLTLYGADLVVEHRLKRREMVALRLSSGGRINTRVRWRVGRRTGVQFLSPVADFAQLLRESRKVAALASTQLPQPQPPYICTRQHKPGGRLRRTLYGAHRFGRRLLRWCRSL